VWDGLVPAAAALEHVKRLSRAGVGYKSVAAAADVSSTTIMAMRAGRKTRIRASTEARILGVDRAAVADGAKVQAGRAWKRIRSLLEEGYSKAELARRLGKRQPALQLGRGRMTAINASMVERLYRTIMEVPA